jgi:hypothetical protein
MRALGAPFERLTWEGSVGTSRSAPDADQVRVRYEQVAALYAMAEAVSDPRPAPSVSIELVADFLCSIRSALTRPNEGRALYAAISRYERDRNPEVRT